jgi:hypothetical protein
MTDCANDARDGFACALMLLFLPGNKVFCLLVRLSSGRAGAAISSSIIDKEKV